MIKLVIDQEFETTNLTWKSLGGFSLLKLGNCELFGRFDAPGRFDGAGRFDGPGNKSNCPLVTSPPFLKGEPFPKGCWCNSFTLIEIIKIKHN